MKGFQEEGSNGGPNGGSRGTSGEGVGGRGVPMIRTYHFHV